jgi:hypothetical protein
MTRHLLLAVIACNAACGGKARKPDMYREDTEKLLTTRNDQLKRCYEDALKNDPKLTGTVKVEFMIEKKTGAIKKPQVVPATATPSALGLCVLQALDGLKLQPADRHEGRATFEYAFQPTKSP